METLEKSKMPPQAVDLEKAVLGVCIDTGNNAAAEMIEILRKEKVFYKAQHQAIYDVILKLYEKSESIDLLSISTELRKINKLEAVGGDYYLIQLTQLASVTSKIEYHCRIIQQMFVKRKSIHVGNQIIEESYDPNTDIFETLESTYKKLDQVSDWLVVKKSTDFKAVVGKLFEAANKKESGIPSSLKKIQSKTNGYQNSDLVIIAARPGMGKTAYVINEAKFQAEQGIPVGIFSLEMSDRQLAGRIAANKFEIDNERISKNMMNEFELRLINERRNELEDLPIYIHDQPAISPLELKIQASKWKREKGVKIIYVDYLQLMRVKGHKGNKEQEVSEISAALKGVAKELDIPVIALAQLSRSVETRGGSKRPILSDLRDSGAIEQDADMVKFIYRPEYYKIDEWDDDSRSPTKDTAEINIAKYRNGRVGACMVATKLQYMQFNDLEETWQDIDKEINQHIENEYLPPPPKNLMPYDAFDAPDDSKTDVPF